MAPKVMPKVFKKPSTKLPPVDLKKPSKKMPPVVFKKPSDSKSDLKKPSKKMPPVVSEPDVPPGSPPSAEPNTDLSQVQYRIRRMVVLHANGDVEEIDDTAGS